MRFLQAIRLMILAASLAGGARPSALASPQSSPGAISVSVVVSVKAKHGKEIPDVPYKEDVRVFEGQVRLPVTDWVALKGEHANLEMLVLIDSAVGQSVSNKLEEIRRFIAAQPPTTTVAVGYIENGVVRLEQNFTTDRDAASRAIHLPAGPVLGTGSPHIAILGALGRWRGSNSRHTIFLISDGVDPVQRGIANTYRDDAVEAAQRTGTQIFCIYATRPNRVGRTLALIKQGQDNLSELAAGSGGDAYFQGNFTPVSFTPSLDEFTEQLAHQYLLSFLIRPDKKPSYRRVRLDTEIPNAQLVTSERVFVPPTP